MSGEHRKTGDTGAIQQAPFPCAPEQRAQKPTSVSPETRRRDLNAVHKTESDVVTFLTESIKFEPAEDAAKIIEHLTPKQWKRLLSLVRGDVSIDITWQDAIADFWVLCPEWQHSPEKSKAVLFHSFPDHAYMRVVRVQTTKICAGHAVLVALHMQKCILAPADHVVYMPDLSDLYVKMNSKQAQAFLAGYMKNACSVGVSVFLQTAYGIGARFKEIYRLTSATSEEMLARQRDECERIMVRLRTRPAILSFVMGSDFRVPGKFSYDGTPSMEAECVQSNYKQILHAVVLVGARRTGDRFFFMAQNFWESKQFVEFSDEYLARSEATVTFIKDAAPLDLITPLRQRVRCFAGQSVETAPEFGDSEDSDDCDGEDTEDID